MTTETAILLLKSAKTDYNKLIAKINKKGKPNTFAFKANLVTTYGTMVTDVHSPNVLGYLEGSDLKDELIVISAHYDHVGIGANGEIFNGADDDASGTTGVLEIANAFSKAKREGHGPRRSILFLAVTAEEKGLLGSDYYTRHPIVPLKNTVTNLNIDMIGRVDPKHEGKPAYIYTIGSDKLSSTLHQISEDVNTKYTKLDIDYKYNDPNDPERIYYRSDHYNFAKNGIPVIFYFNGVHADYHKATDTIEKINFDQLVQRTKLVFHTAWEVANRDQRLVVDSNKK
jgi:Zn-dependent M28 family amino/carboxypeptidase